MTETSQKPVGQGGTTERRRSLRVSRGGAIQDGPPVEWSAVCARLLRA